RCSNKILTSAKRKRRHHSRLFRSISSLNLDIQVLHIERIVFNELAPRLNVFTHERGEDRFCFGDVFELHGEKCTMLGIHRRFPELRCSHLAQAFIALYLVLATSLFDDVLKKVMRRLLLDRLMRSTSDTLWSRLARFDFACCLALGLFRIRLGRSSRCL